MLAPSHFMVDRFSGFDEPVDPTTGMSSRLVGLLAIAAVGLQDRARRPCPSGRQGRAKDLRRRDRGPASISLTVRLTDLDSGGQIRGASVSASAEMATPHTMRTAPWIA